MIQIVFLTPIIQLCTTRTKDVLHINFVALRTTPHMGQHYTIIWLHGKKTFRNGFYIYI